MKHLSIRTLVQTALLLLLSGVVSKAQLISGEGFLKGDYLELGICSNGALGSTINAPTGYHPRPGYARTGELSLVADVDKDGWTVGTPLAYQGDFLMPDFPHEGWDLQAGPLLGRARRSATDSFLKGGLTGRLVSVTNTGTNLIAVWEGALGNIFIQQTITLPKDRLYFKIDVKLKNVGLSHITNMFYMRSFDPDNKASFSVDHNTINKIDYQLPNSKSIAMVTASVVDTPSVIGLATLDCRAKAFKKDAGLEILSMPNDIYNKTGDASAYIQDSTHVDTSDRSVGLVFKIGYILAGDSTALSMVYFLDRSEFDTARLSGMARLSDGIKEYTAGDTIRGCPGDTLSLSVVNTSFSSWVWTPAATSGIGLTNKVVVGNGPNTVTAALKASVCSYPTSIRLTVMPYQLKPKLVASGATLSTSGTYATYEWHETSAPAPVGSAASHTATYSGDYYLIATDAHGCTYYSDTLSVIGTGIEELQAHPELIAVYPNPATDRVHIAAPAPVNVTLRDLTGRVAGRKENAVLLELDNLADGVYFLELTDTQNRLIGVRKIIKAIK